MPKTDDRLTTAIELQEDTALGKVDLEKEEVEETAADTTTELKKEEHHGHSHEEEFAVWRIHEYYGDYPIGCYCVVYCSFCFFLFLMIILMVAGVEVLNVTTEFPFYIQDHRSFERQDGTTVAHDDNTWSPSGSGSGTERTEFDDTIVHVMFIGDNDGNVLTPSRLQAIKDFEDKLTGKDDWKNEMCYLMNDECQRPTSSSYFYADDSKNTYPFFPMNDYDDYPSYNNTIKYKTSYYSQPAFYDFELDFTDPDPISAHWDLYKKDGGAPKFEYFETSACERQRQKCDEVLAGVNITNEADPNMPIRFMEGICIDNNTAMAGRDRTSEIGTDTYDILNCDQLMNYTLGLGVGCDDFLEFLDLPDMTTRMICCESCFNRWFPSTFTNVDDSVTTLNSATCAADVDNNKLLEVCLDSNKGTFTTITTLIVTGATDEEVAAGVGTLFTGNSIQYNSISYSSAASPGTLDCSYPWSTEQTHGKNVLQNNDFPGYLAAELPDGATVSHVDTAAPLSTDGKDEVYSFSVDSNPFWQVVDGDFGSNADPDIGRQAKAVKTMLFLGLPLKDYDSVSDDRETQIEDLGQLCYDNWQDIFDDGVGHGMDVYWYCETMDTAFTNAQLVTDFLLITFTVIFVFLYMTFATGSYWLSCNGMFMIFMNFVPTIVLYRFICQQKFFGILQIMSMFLILAIGADDIFVLIDTWAQTNCEHYQDRSLKERLSFTLNSASKVMLTTSASTIFSFIANCSSSFPAIYTFGMFCAILIFVNYCAVCLFYPAVLVVHELYFDGEGIDRTPVAYCNCACRTEPEGLKERYARYADIPERKDLIPDPSEKRPIDMWFSNTFYGFVHRARMAIIFGGAIFFCIFLAGAATIEPDPAPPNIFPDGHNYGVFWDKFTEYFSRSTSDQAVIAWIVTGLTPNGIHRGSGHDPTDPSELGDPTYDVDFNPFGAAEMEWMCAMCDDLESGRRYGDADNRMVDETDDGAEEAVQCPWTAFRDWIWDKGSAASYELNGGINPITLDYLDQTLVDCMKAENNGVTHPVGTWPITGFWNTWQRWEDWLADEMPVSTPGYTQGTTNWGYWSSQLYYNEDIWTDGVDSEGNAFSWAADCAGVTIQNTPKLFQADIRLSVSSTFEYTNGITLYEDWEDWLDKWLSAETGDYTDYTPSSSHCADLSPINVCEDRDGCTWDVSVCIATPLPYPTSATMPTGIKSMFVTDGGTFSYYYLQEQLLVECITGIALALFLAFIILNWATKNYIVATISTVVISMIVLMIIGFCVFLGWKLGILESIIFVMVVGMSVDYVVHLAEAYLEAGETHIDRHSRSRDMLEARGFSILSGAISTLGGIFFLFFAFIVFFYKFAVVIFALIACSLAYSLLFFTAIMDSFGPSGEFGEWHTVIDDMKHVKNGDMTISECIHNCCVPHDSVHQPRTIINMDVHYDSDEDKQPEM